MTQKEIKLQFISAWIKARKAQAELDLIKSKALEIIKNGEVVKGYQLSIAKKPVFSDVTLETAREFNAVHKVPDTSKLSQLLKTGAEIEGVKFTKYILVKSL